MATTASEVGIEQAEFTTGRGGLLLPDIEWRSGYGSVSVVDFFRRFWVANSDKPESHYYDAYGRFVVSSLDTPGHEVVLPAEGDKPLVVVRSSFTPKIIKMHQVNLSAVSPNEGTEKHQVLVPPSAPGPFTVYAEVTDTRDVLFEGQWQYVRTDTPELADMPDDENRWKAAEALHEKRLQGALTSIVELLS